MENRVFGSNISETGKIGPRLLLRTNTCFRLVPTSVILGDLERSLCTVSKHKHHDAVTFL